jgi:hypothetical protein
MKWAGFVAHVVRGRTSYILTGKVEKKRPLGRLSCRCEDNIKINL